MKEERYKPLLLVYTPDLGNLIHYSPNDDEIILLSQTLAAILLGAEKLDKEQIDEGIKSLEAFLNENIDRMILYNGAGMLIVLPNEYEEKISELREALDRIKDKIKLSSYSIKYWKDFGLNYDIILVAIDLSLRSNCGISTFISKNKENLKKYQEKALEYRRCGIYVLN